MTRRQSVVITDPDGKTSKLTELEIDALLFALQSAIEWLAIGFEHRDATARFRRDAPKLLNRLRTIISLIS